MGRHIYGRYGAVWGRPGFMRGVIGVLSCIHQASRAALMLVATITSPLFAQDVPAPANLEATEGDGTVVLTWDGPRVGAVRGYEVRHFERGQPPPEVWMDIEWKAQPDIDVVTHAVTGLMNRVEYTFEVRAYTANARGNVCQGPGGAAGAARGAGGPHGDGGLRGGDAVVGRSV